MPRKFHLIFLLFITSVRSENHKIRIGTQLLDEALIKLLFEIIEQHGEDKTGITILNYDGSNDHLLNSIFSVIRRSGINGLYIFNKNGSENIAETTCYLVILNECCNETLLEHNVINTRSIIFLFFANNSDRKLLERTLKNYWIHNYFNVFALMQSQTDVNLLTYYGFKNMYEYIPRNKYSKRKLLDKTKDLNNQTINVLFTFNDLTKIRKVKDYEGKAEKYEGKDYDIITTIFQHLNADLQVIDIDDIIPDPSDNPWFTSVEMDNKTEFQIEILKKWNITMLTKSQRVLENDGVIEVTYPHTDNAITILLPKRRKITKLEEVFEYFTQPLWYLHFSISIVLSLLLMLFRKYFGISQVLDTVRHLYRIMLTCSSQGFIGTKFEGLILLGWTVWCFLSSIIVQAKITSMLSSDLYESELDSIEDIYRRGKADFIIFGLNSIIDEVAEKYEGSKYLGIIQDMVKVPMDENLGEMMLFEMPKATTFKMAIVLEHDIAKLYARHVKNRQDGWGRPFLHLMKHSLLFCFQVFHVRAGSPLLPVINIKIRQLFEGGFIVYFKQKFLFKGLIDGYLYPDEDTDVDVYKPKAIDMDLAKYAFLLLSVGLVISTLCFFIEIILHIIKNIFKKYNLTF